MHAFDILGYSRITTAADAARWAPAAINVHPRCTLCHGPLRLAACIGPNPSGPAQRVYSCIGCEHLEWFE